jgi:hypothetical protein
MTLKECYELIIEMWDWLAANPDKGKEDFLLSHPEYPECEYDCAACEYMCQKDRWNDLEAPAAPDCKLECPLKGVWPDGCCNGSNSLYNQWSDAWYQSDWREVTAIAKKIADHAREKLAELQPPL